MRALLRVLGRPFAALEDWFFAHTPRILLTDTFQVGFAIAFLAVGLLSLLALFGGVPPGAIGHALPTDLLRIVWGSSLIVGGGFQLLGLQWISRDAERFGMTMTMVGCVIYGLALFAFATTASGLILGLLFVSFAAIYWIRLRTSARAVRLGVTA